MYDNTIVKIVKSLDYWNSHINGLSHNYIMIFNNKECLQSGEFY